MEHIINDLRGNHIWIKHLLTEVQFFGIDTQRGYEKAAVAHKEICSHFYAEEKFLLPLLREKSLENKQLAILVRKFERDLIMITNVVDAFHFKCCDKKTYRAGMNPELAMISNLLTNRIFYDEEILYKRYEMTAEPEKVAVLV